MRILGRVIPALFLSHGAPPLVDDEQWVSQLAAWSAELPRPEAILVVSAHWEAAPLTIGSTTTRNPADVRLLGIPAALLRRHLRRPARPTSRAGRGLMPDSEPSPTTRPPTRPRRSATSPGPRSALSTVMLPAATADQYSERRCRPDPMQLRLEPRPRVAAGHYVRRPAAERAFDRLVRTDQPPRDESRRVGVAVHARRHDSCHGCGRSCARTACGFTLAERTDTSPTWTPRPHSIGDTATAVRVSAVLRDAASTTDDATLAVLARCRRHDRPHRITRRRGASASR